jgi:nitrogen fixation protein NifU and related proteins
MYTDIVLDHFRNPRNLGEIINADSIGEAGDTQCGDYLKLYIMVEDNLIKDIKFQVSGCCAAIASSSMTTVMVKGKHLLYAYALTRKDISDALGGLPAEKEHCSLLGERALKDAISNYMKRVKQPKDNNDSTGRR